MTGFGVGHPDWQAYANWRDIFATASNVTVPHGGQIPIGNFVTTNWSSLVVAVDASTTGVELQISWFADTARTQFVNFDQWEITADTDIIALVPCKGNLAEIVISNNNAVDEVVDYTIQPTNVVTPYIRALDSPLRSALFGTTLLHNATASLFPTELIGGPTYVLFSPNDTTGKLNMNLETLNSSKVAQSILINSVAPVAPVAFSLIVPAEPLRAVVTNTDGVSSHTFSLSIVSVSQ